MVLKALRFAERATIGKNPNTARRGRLCDDTIGKLVEHAVSDNKAKKSGSDGRLENVTKT
jgi:hypothetical protein